MSLKTSWRLAWQLHQPVPSHTSQGCFQILIFAWKKIITGLHTCEGTSSPTDLAIPLTYLIFNISPVSSCVTCKGEMFSSPFCLIRLSAPLESLRPLCLTSLSVSHYGDPSLNSPTGLEGGSSVLVRDTHQQHRRNPLPGLHSCVSYLVLATAGILEGFTLTVYRIPLCRIENCDSLRFEDWWW